MEEKDNKNKNIPSLQDAITGSGGLISQIEKEKQRTANSEKYSSVLKPLRTYQGDVDNAISNTNASVVSIAIAEQKKKIAETPNYPMPKVEKKFNRNKFFVISGIIFFILGIVSLSTVYFLRSNQTLPKTNNINSIISYNDIFNFQIASTTRKDFIKTILQNKKDYNNNLNSILFINTVTNNSKSPTKNLMDVLAPNMPPQLERSLSNDYMVGMYVFESNQPFIILKTDDFGASYSGMLKWEETMVSDLGQIFEIPTVTASTTPYVFLDEALKNKDLRIVKDKNGKTILLYSFVDKKTIIIANSENIFSALMVKYFTNQVVR